MAHYLQGAPRSDDETFLVFTYFWQKSVEKVFKVPGCQRNINPHRAITWLVGVTIYCTILNNNPPPPRQFFRGKILLKKKFDEGNACYTNQLI